MTDAPRIHSTDVLAQMQSDLCQAALRLTPHDCEARQGWIDAARQLLAAVPDKHQRLAWAIQLALAFALHLPGTPVELIVRQLQEEA